MRLGNSLRVEANIFPTICHFYLKYLKALQLQGLWAADTRIAFAMFFV